ncbi:hypothetical protein GS397_23760 [Sphingobium yanoikuyae]|uniref:Class I SAM-dependent methyltransferase n=1 Tax=Sphingobium yanoikuyae TaxID=13690 RepID=A0A6P1GMK8_SPHYA|nr:class I SAM-dependent methyltransferase [Sphingobium yanoikuyae]QHD69749.1 hypothetical protein GS397_23760 [Sphingobium yanoikuyae]
MTEEMAKAAGAEKANSISEEMIPSLEPEGRAALEDYLSRCETYLEYGCGGSTYVAAKSGVKTICAVDTSLEWIEDVERRTRGFPPRITLRHCDVGPVASWGHPVDAREIHQFHRYAILPWDAARATASQPDLVFVDGRFRVASFLYSLMSARAGTIILFDDYMDRAQYHEVEKFCKRVDNHGRMAVFLVGEQRPLVEIAESFARYSIIPA